MPPARGIDARQHRALRFLSNPGAAHLGSGDRQSARALGHSRPVFVEKPGNDRLWRR